MCLFRSMRRALILHARNAKTLHRMGLRSRGRPRMVDDRLPSELRQGPSPREADQRR